MSQQSLCKSNSIFNWRPKPLAILLSGGGTPQEGVFFLQSFLLLFQNNLLGQRFQLLSFVLIKINQLCISSTIHRNLEAALKSFISSEHTRLSFNVLTHL